MHTLKTEDGTVFHFNSDFSGEISSVHYSCQFLTIHFTIDGEDKVIQYDYKFDRWCLGFDHNVSDVRCAEAAGIGVGLLNSWVYLMQLLFESRSHEVSLSNASSPDSCTSEEGQ